MPELPEVETVVRSITPHVVGHKIVHALLSSARVTRGNHSETADSLAGRVVERVRRHGKQIFFELDCGMLYVHLGMTGKLLWNALPSKHTRAVLTMDNGTLLYDDARMFGRVEYHAEIPSALAKAGPDALVIDAAEFCARLKQHRGPIKALLLNQNFISGVGNIYADESLFAARIHPRAGARRISRERAVELHGQLVEILGQAIRHKGSSISDYVNAAGEKGSFQQMHAVYGRAGSACLRCGQPIRRIVLGQRGTHYCPRCQRV